MRLAVSILIYVLQSCSYTVNDNKLQYGYENLVWNTWLFLSEREYSTVFAYWK